MATGTKAITFLGTFVGCSKLGDLNIYEDHILKVDQNGFISLFCHSSTLEGETALNIAKSNSTLKVLPKYSFFLPTFCDLHLHAPQTLYLGTGLHLPLMEWLKKYAYNAEIRIDEDPELAYRVYDVLVKRLIEHGTGAVLFFGTIKKESNLILAKICQKYGLRGFIGKLSMDISSHPSYVESSPKDSATAAKEFIDECKNLVSHLPVHERLVEPVITPRFVPTCTMELLSRLGQLASENDVWVQSHMAESKDQVAWVRSTRGLEDMDVFIQSGLLASKTIQAHCTFLPNDAFPELQTLGTGIAHCPLSNTYFSSRPFPLREALDSGVKIGLGTDIAGGYEMDIMNAMRQAVITARMRDNTRIEEEKSTSSLRVDWKESIYLATVGGATALGLVSQDSQPFQVGLPFDAQQIDLYDEHKGEGVGNLDFFDEPEKGLTVEMLEKWWCLGDTRNRSAMYVQGKKIL
ncbi:hypothetical protein M422DRAFT_25158 [Sphaerobolus stellatus SS14]|nr:hypothetical protein M422DRAFT_25158 [Sphaerobolus stellatus SS14]